MIGVTFESRQEDLSNLGAGKQDSDTSVSREASPKQPPEAGKNGPNDL